MDNPNLIAALWIGLALVAILVSIRLGISVVLFEIGLGVLGGNVLGLQTTPWIDFLAAFGAILLTFLAGAEIDPESLRRRLRPSLLIGGINFASPALAAFLQAARQTRLQRQNLGHRGHHRLLLIRDPDGQPHRHATERGVLLARSHAG